jgi:hypothetical protein
VSAVTPNRKGNGFIGASLFVTATSRHLYEVLLDVQSFPSWAPGVRHVDIVEGSIGPGMVSEWEVSVLGLRRRISSVLVEAESPRFLRWTYEGFIHGWGECSINDRSYGTLAEFKTELNPTEPTVKRLMQTLPARNAVKIQLKRCLVRLGRTVAGNGGQVRVGPLERA